MERTANLSEFAVEKVDLENSFGGGYGGGGTAQVGDQYWFGSNGGSFGGGGIEPDRPADLTMMTFDTGSFF